MEEKTEAWALLFCQGIDDPKTAVLGNGRHVFDVRGKYEICSDR
jgi:hypothetical protein